MACVRKRRNRWIIDFYDQFGRRHWETVGRNKKKAEERLAERLLEVRKETFRPENKIKTFSEVTEAWYQTVVLPNKRPNTARYYRTMLDTHLLPHFGRVKLGRIDVGMIERYISKKAKEGVGRVTINKTITTLGTVLIYAIKHRYIDYNPVPNVDRPKRNPQEHLKERIHYLKPEEIRLLLKHAEQRYRVLFMTLILTGMRLGELLGLQWGDIDWNVRQIYVRRTLQGGKFYLPKTPKSKRRIDIWPELIFELKKWKLECPKGELDLVFPNSVGKPENGTNVYHRGFLPALRRAKLPKIRIIDCRHTYASLQIKKNAHPKYISEQMGHSSIKVTMDVYSHIMEAANHKAAEGLEAEVFGRSLAK